MSLLAPRIAAVLASVGIVCLLIAALLGVTPMSDDVLDVAEVSFVLATIIFLGYITIGLANEFAQSQTKHDSTD
jgi:uncharacterized membrane protein YtjA (UPF0391 family)